MSDLISINSDALAKGTELQEITPDQAQTAITKANMPGISLEEWENRAKVGKHMAPTAHGAIFAVSAVLSHHAEKLVELCMEKINDPDTRADERRAAIVSVNETIKNWSTLALTQMKAAEVTALSNRNKHNKKLAPQINAGVAYVTQNVLNTNLSPNGHNR